MSKSNGKWRAVFAVALAAIVASGSEVAQSQQAQSQPEPIAQQSVSAPPIQH